MSVIWGNGKADSENVRGRQMGSEAIPATEERNDSDGMGHRSKWLSDQLCGFVCVCSYACLSTRYSS